MLWNNILKVKHLIFSNLSIQFITFFTSIISARYLGPEGRGMLALIFLYPQTIANIFLLGINKGLAISIGKKELNNIEGIVVIITFFLTLVSWLILCFIMYYNNKFSKDMLQLIILYSLYIPMFFLFMFAVSIMQGKGEFKKYSLFNVMYYTIYLILLLIVIQLNLQVEGFVYANLMTSFILSIFSICYLIHCSYFKIHNINLKTEMKVLLKNSYIFIIPMTIYILTTKIDQFLIINYLDFKSLGLFIVYLAISRLASPITNAFRVYMFHKSIKEEISFVIFLKQNFILYFLITLCLLIFAKYIVIVLYGNAYLEDISSLFILILSSFFYFIGHLAVEYLNGRKIVRNNIYSNISYIIILCISFFLFIGLFKTQKNGLLLFSYALLIAEIIRTTILIKGALYEDK